MAFLYGTGGPTGGFAYDSGDYASAARPSLHYAGQTDMVTRFGDVELVQLTNRVRTATAIDSVVLERALEDADAEINASLQPRYSLPLASTPRLLVNIACDIARYRLYEDRATDHVRRRYDDAVSMLNRIRKGEIQLGLNALQETTPSVGGAAHKATRRTFSRDSLRDYGGG